MHELCGIGVGSAFKEQVGCAVRRMGCAFKEWDVLRMIFSGM